MSNDRDALLQPDRIEADEWSALGSKAVWIGPANTMPPAGVQSVLIGVDAAGTLNCNAPDAFDVLLTTCPDAPAPWISVAADRFAPHVDLLASAVQGRPVAAPAGRPVQRGKIAATGRTIGIGRKARQGAEGDRSIGFMGRATLRRAVAAGVWGWEMDDGAGFEC